MRYYILILASILIFSSCASLPFGKQERRAEVAGPSVMGRQAVAAANGSGRDSGDNGQFRLGPRFAEELRGKVAEEIKELDGDEQSIPVTLNENVKSAVEFLANDRRTFMTQSLQRSGRYLPMMRKIFKEKGLPPDLTYLVLIESGFHLQACSWAGAVGPWQFIAATGKRYGLTIDEWVDERMDPLRATNAAADYLSDLHEMFGSWYLAAAAYNAGEGKILRGLKKYNATNFWEIAEGNYLRQETKNYVPKFLAAVLIAKEPERYGLTGITPDPPLAYDEVIVSEATDLAVLAKMAGTDLETIKSLNPQFKLWCTPLGARDYRILVPKGRGQLFYTNYAKTPAKERLTSSTHIVRYGESLQSIAKLYGITASSLKTFNGLKSSSLRKGQKIRLPVGADVYLAKQNELKAAREAEKLKLASSGKLNYKVRPGDSPWSISVRFGVRPDDLMEWNGLKNAKGLRVGSTLVIYGKKAGEAEKKSASPKVVAQKNNKTAVPEVKAAPVKDSTVKTTAATNKAGGSSRPASYVVQDGENLWRISTRFGLTPEQVQKWNGLKDNSIQPGQVLLLSAPGAESAPSASRKGKKAESGETTTTSAVKGSKGETYTVKQNETVWKISSRFKVSPEALRAANGLKDNNIHPGQVLIIPASSGKALARSQKTEAAPEVSYTVKDGDTLWKIAQRFKVAPDQIKSWNEMKDNNIRPGDVLTIKKDQT